MDYIIKQKEKRPAGDWFIVAQTAEGKSFMNFFTYEPTAEQVDEAAKEALAASIIRKEQKIIAEEKRKALDSD
tara:strand:+ start:276 stop:494 length:219 start_codon:yes stop_codon:yes gene_type:complete